MKIHPLKCPYCEEYRFIEYEDIRFMNDENNKGFGVNIPFFICKKCDKRESILPQEQFVQFQNDILPSIKEGEFFDMPLKFIFSRLDHGKTFKRFDHLGFKYDPCDYYIIPGLYRDWDEGYLTPVFFDSDLLLYYNSHPEYSVKLTSFSSGNIYYKGDRMFEWGFGINRYGRIFKWLGDLDKDFKCDVMTSHLKRFQASNIKSDHEIVSKFYLSQNPFSVEDAFQTSDNETRIFSMINDFNNQIKKKYGVELTKVNIEQLKEYYKPPILEEKEQVFNSYISLNKYLIENLQTDSIESVLLNHGLSANDFRKNGKKIGSLKLFTLFIEAVLQKNDANSMVSPLFVLNDLRQLQGHLHDSSYNKKYEFCKERLGLFKTATDMEVFKALINHLIIFYKSIIEGHVH